jgi:uncharacterized membrane protein YoaK (UPF0700 family)
VLNGLFRFVGLSILSALLLRGLLLLVPIAGFVVLGCFTSRIAAEKGRNPTGWFFLGGLTGLFGLVAALMMLPAEYYIGGSSRRSPTT